MRVHVRNNNYSFFACTMGALVSETVRVHACMGAIVGDVLGIINLKV